MVDDARKKERDGPLGTTTTFSTRWVENTPCALYKEVYLYFLMTTASAI